MQPVYKKIGECIETQRKDFKIQTSQYLPAGELPVIDQGADFIAGYIDDPAKAYTGPLPVIVFGDHTCCLKYVSVRFAVGADGTQLIRPNSDFDVRYFYYALRDQKMEHFGYQRHFKLLKAKDVPWFPLSTQRKIAALLSAYDDLIENNLRRIKILEEMAQNLYHEWFVKFRFPGHQHARFINSPLGRIPEGWEVVQLGEMADVRWGDTSTTKSSYVSDGYTAYSATGADGALDHYDYDRDGIVLSAIGANCGLTWFASGKWSCIKNTIRFWSCNPRVSTEYLFFATLGRNFWPKRGAAQPFISQGDAKEIAIVIPDNYINQQFEDFIKPTLAQFKSLSKKSTTLRCTRDLLLPKLISGAVDVSALDIALPEETST